MIEDRTWRNFYTDNDDIQFLFKHIDLAPLAEAFEEGFRFAKEFDYAPDNAADAIDNYALVLDSLGELSARLHRPAGRGRRPRGQHAQRGRLGHPRPRASPRPSRSSARPT